MKLISKRRLGSSQVAAVMTQRLIRGILARRRYKKMTSLPEAELVVNAPAVIATVESVVVIEDAASYELVDFTVEDYKFYSQSDRRRYLLVPRCQCLQGIRR